MSATTSAYEEDPLGETLLATLAAIGRQVRRRAGRPIEFERLTGAQLELVRTLRRRPGISVADAASELHLAPNTVSTLVRQLSDAGLVFRRTDDSDHRVVRLELSPEMRGALDSFRDRRLVALATGAEMLSHDDRRTLEAALPALRRLGERLRESERAGPHGQETDTSEQRRKGDG
ncbi:MAG: MarR family transcriptional regulator [Acidimicrobiales bacterium]